MGHTTTVFCPQPYQKYSPYYRRDLCLGQMSFPTLTSIHLEKSIIDKNVLGTGRNYRKLYTNFLCNCLTCNILRHWWSFWWANLGIRTKIGLWFWAKFAYRNDATKRAWSNFWSGSHIWNKTVNAEVLRGKLSRFLLERL